MADKKVWVVSKALFPMEDPTNVGTSEKLTRIEGQDTKLVPRTAWIESQIRAGSLEEYDGNPAEGGKLVPVAAAPAPAAPAAPAPAPAAENTDATGTDAGKGADANKGGPKK